MIGAKQRGDGYLEGGGYLVSWCLGHLAGLAEADAYDKKYAKWRREDLLILPESWRFTVGKDKWKQFDILRTLMRRDDVSEVINACDAGREGELIFRTVYWYFNQQPYGGEVAADRGKPRMQVFNENLHSKRVASAEDLNLI